MNFNKDIILNYFDETIKWKKRLDTAMKLDEMFKKNGGTTPKSILDMIHRNMLELETRLHVIEDSGNMDDFVEYDSNTDY